MKRIEKLNQGASIHCAATLRHAKVGEGFKVTGTREQGQCAKPARYLLDGKRALCDSHARSEAFDTLAATEL